jgi:hypothetical protein
MNFVRFLRFSTFLGFLFREPQIFILFFFFFVGLAGPPLDMKICLVLVSLLVFFYFFVVLGFVISRVCVLRNKRHFFFGAPDVVSLFFFIF